MKLFDDFPRTDFESRDYSEPYFQYWNSTARTSLAYLRQVVETWFSSIEANQDKLEKLLGEFRSEDNKVHLSAFFEIYLYNLFKRIGFKIEVEPILKNGKKPDFLLEDDFGNRFYLEATCNYPDSVFGGAKKLENLVLDEINKRVKSSEFFIHLRLWDVPTDNPPFAKIGRFLNKKLSELDADELIKKLETSSQNNIDLLPTVTWQHKAWSAEFTISPKKPESRHKKNQNIIGIISFGLMSIDDKSSIRSRIDSKYGHYGELEIPYILAMNVFGEYVRADSIIEALFGDEQFTVIDGQAHPFRKPNGSWRDINGWQKSRMSGLLVCREMYPHMVGFVEPTLFHHPKAQNPLDTNILPISQIILNADTSNLDLIEGDDVNSFLGGDIAQFKKLMDIELNR